MSYRIFEGGPRESSEFIRGLLEKYHDALCSSQCTIVQQLRLDLIWLLVKNGVDFEGDSYFKRVFGGQKLFFAFKSHHHFQASFPK